MKGKLLKYAAVLSALALLASCGTTTTSEQSSEPLPPSTSVVVPPSESEPEPSSIDTTVHVSSIAFAEGEITIEKGDTKVVGISVLPADADNKAYEVVSDHPEFATYDKESGLVTAVAPGDAVITATAEDGGLTATLTVHVTEIKAKSISFAEEEVSLEQGEELLVEATVLPAEAANKAYTVVSDHPEIASYDNTTHKVTGVAVGDAILTATTDDGGHTATITVHVRAISVKSIAFAEEEVSLEQGEELLVEATVLPAEAANKAYTVVSDHPEIAAYDNVSHKVSGVSVGDAVLTATTADGGFTASITVHVLAVSAKSISFADASLSIMASDSVVVEATVLPANAANKAYTVVSDHPEIASYDNETHTLTGVAPGEAILTATTEDGGYTATLPVTVTRNIYESEDWEEINGSRGYSFEDNGTIVSHVEDETNFSGSGPHYNFTNPRFLLSTSNMPALERGLNYTISGEVYSETLYQNNQVTKEIDAGVVVWYKDANNFLTVGVKWANWDRPSEVRSIYLAGKVNGSNINAMDAWTDNCAVDPYLFHSLEVTKIHNVFSFKAYKTNDDRVKIDTPFKTGQFTVPQLTREVEGTSTRLGLYGVNDNFVFSNLQVSPETVQASHDQVTYTCDGEPNLVLDTWFGTYTLGEETGSYVQDGLNLTLTPASGEPHEVTINVGAHTYSLPVIDTDPQFELDGRSGEVKLDAFTGITDRNFKVEFDIYGTSSQAISAKVGLYTRYVSDSDFSNVYVEWSSGERPGQIREVQIHNWNGSSDSWGDVWCDGSDGSYTAVGYHMIIVKTGDTYDVDLTNLATGFHKTGSLTKPTSSGAYDVKWFAVGDKFTIKNATFDFGGNYTISEGSDAVIEEPTKVKLSTGTAIYEHAFSGAHTFDVDVKGTKFESVTGDVNAEFYPWYVDADNYIKVQVQWRSWDRAYEIRELNINGKIGGTNINGEWGFETFCDQPSHNNALPNDGFHLTVSLSASSVSASISLASGWVSNTCTANKTFDLTSYKIGYEALGDTFTFSNLVIA